MRDSFENAFRFALIKVFDVNFLSTFVQIKTQR